MKDFKEIIAKEIAKLTTLEESKIKENLEVPKDATNGDYAFPCFILAKVLKKAPAIIATELQTKIAEGLDNEDIEEVTAINGFLNFKINKLKMAEEVVKEFDEKKENYGSDNQNKNIVIDYSSPNIAKPFHVGHLRSTVIGGALYNIYKFLGNNVTGVNHLGDYGTQFGKLIEGYKRWGEEWHGQPCEGNRESLP